MFLLILYLHFYEVLIKNNIIFVLIKHVNTQILIIIVGKQVIIL